MIRSMTWLLLSLTVVPAHAAGTARTEKDIAYSQAGGERTRLDVYAPAEGKDHPVVVWIHGGAWQIGDKAQVQSKPRAFNDRGYVFVSVNYRFHPAVTYKEQAGDIAQAIRWVKDHARDHGGDPGRIFLMGHSAGAHLAALVATDGRYLEGAGLKPSDLSGVVLLDGAGYDIPRQVRQAVLPRMKSMYTTVFTEDEATGPETAIPMLDPTISRVVYREVTPETRQVWLAFDAPEGLDLYVQVGVPVIDRLKGFRPAMAVVGPGLPTENPPFPLPPGCGAKVLPTSDVAEPRFFHEPFSDTDSWI